MSSDADNLPPLDLILVGLPARRAELLGAALGRVEPRIRFRVNEQPPEELGWQQVEGTILLAACEGADDCRSLLAAARRLRTEEFYWGPIHLCLRATPTAAEEEWATFFHALPPDVRGLAGALVSGQPLSQTRREDIVRAALVSLADDVGALLRSLDASSVVEPERVKRNIAAAIAELGAHASDERFDDLLRELNGLNILPEITRSELEAVMPRIVNAESKLLDDGRQERLLATLHKLNNVLRLACYERGDAADIAARVLSKIHSLRERGLSALPDEQRAAKAAILETVETLARAALEGDADNRARESLAEQSSKLYEHLFQSSASTRGVGVVGVVAPVPKRIVVVEDDTDWRRLIVGALKVLFPGGELEVQEAGTLAAAQLLLREAAPALALVDLGLPASDESDIVMDAGLSLIKRFSGPDGQGRRYQHRFIVLTAAENYSAAVRDAVGLGVAPANYLQKNPATWESDLRAQVRLALQPPAARLPSVEVFKRTGRIARVEGLEIKLDYPHWCMLAALAEMRSGLWCEAERLASVLYWNYSLNPESRGGENDERDEEQNIRRQLPYYASELRKRLSDAYRKATQHPPADELLLFDEEVGYRLRARARVLDRVEEHFRVGRAPSVLVVEDSEDWGREIAQGLAQRGFATRHARWINEALEMIEAERPDLISLDLELPLTREGWERGEASSAPTVEFLRRLRGEQTHIPVAILTAIAWRDSVMLEILREGVRVDDYLSKHWDEPVARLAGSLARLWQETLNSTYILDWDATTPVHPITIDRAQQLLVEVAGFPVKPTGQGRDVLKALSATPNVFVSRAELLDVLYGKLDDPDAWPEDPEKALNQHLKRLRRVIYESTNKTIPGEQVVCGERGIYWLRGIVQ